MCETAARDGICFGTAGDDQISIERGSRGRIDVVYNGVGDSFRPLGDRDRPERLDQLHVLRDRQVIAQSQIGPIVPASPRSLMFHSTV